MNIEIIKKGLLEFGRVVVLAIIPVMIASLEKGEIDWKVIGITAIIALLKAIDRALHEYGVEKEEETGEPSEYIKGIVRF